MRIVQYLLVWAWIAARAAAAIVQEDFSTDPSARGWRRFGETSLFEWNAAVQAIAVTWDSSKSNSYFYQSLGTVLTASDDVQVSFDIQLSELAIGIAPGKPFTFEVAAGLCNLREATSANFIRGTASQSPDLIEFDYFPDSGFGATISPVIVSSNNQFMPSFTFPFELTVGDRFHVQMSYSATNRVCATSMQRNDQPFGPIKDVMLGPAFTDYRVDSFSISSYSDAGADGSVLAHGLIDNVAVVFPDPPLGALQAGIQKGACLVQFTGVPKWVYTLERTQDFAEWQKVSESVLGSGAVQEIRDDAGPSLPERAFYRVRAERGQ